MAPPVRKRPRGKSPADASFRPNPALSPMHAAYPDDEYDEDAVDRSPGGIRHVSWTPRLEQGATKPNRARGSVSPARSSMKRALVEEDEDEYSDLYEGDRPTADDEKLMFPVEEAGTGKGKGKGGKHGGKRVFKLGEVFGGVPLHKIDDEKARDEALCVEMHDLRSMIVNFSDMFSRPDPALQYKMNTVAKLCENMDNATLVRYIGCLAMGGPDGVVGWEELFYDGLYLETLVAGIVSRALKETVFSSLWFAANEKTREDLEELDFKHAEKDGFYRTEQRAKMCRELTRADLDFSENVAKVSAQLAKQLWFLYDLCIHEKVDKSGKREVIETWAKVQTSLYNIVTFAAKLSMEMRCVGDVVYYWAPTFKDEEFEPARMECYNLKDMIEKSPYRKKKVDGRETAVLQDNAKGQRRDEAIVQIVVALGLIAYRKGGGDLAVKLLEAERAQEDKEAERLPPDVRRARSLSRDSPHKLTGDEGFRTRLICKSVVMLQWGQQRLLTRQAGTSTHIDAMRKKDLSKYEIDRAGFVELFDEFLSRNSEYKVPEIKIPEFTKQAA